MFFKHNQSFSLLSYIQLVVPIVYQLGSLHILATFREIELSFWMASKRKRALQVEDTLMLNSLESKWKSTFMLWDMFVAPSHPYNSAFSLPIGGDWWNRNSLNIMEAKATALARTSASYLNTQGRKICWLVFFLSVKRSWLKQPTKHAWCLMRQV